MFKRLVMCLMFIGFFALAIPQHSSAHCPLGERSDSLSACVDRCWQKYPRTWRDFVSRSLCFFDCEAHYVGHIAGEVIPKVAILAPPVICEEVTGIGAIFVDGPTEIVVTCTDPSYTITSLELEYTTDGVNYIYIGTDSDPSGGWSVVWDVTGLPQDAGLLMISMTTQPGQTPGDEPLKRVVAAVINNPDFDPCGGTSTLQFNESTYSVHECGNTRTIIVTRTGGSYGEVGVDYATSDGTATAGLDYIYTSGTLTFPDGDMTPKTFTVPIIDDNLIEGDETVNLTLSNPTGGATLGTPSEAVLTIIDHDIPPPPNPSLSQWVLIVLALSVGGFFVWQLKRRRKAVISHQ